MQNELTEKRDAHAEKEALKGAVSSVDSEIRRIKSESNEEEMVVHITGGVHALFTVVLVDGKRAGAGNRSGNLQNRPGSAD